MAANQRRAEAAEAAVAANQRRAEAAEAALEATEAILEEMRVELAEARSQMAAGANYVIDSDVLAERRRADEAEAALAEAHRWLAAVEPPARGRDAIGNDVTTNDVTTNDVTDEVQAMRQRAESAEAALAGMQARLAEAQRRLAESAMDADCKAFEQGPPPSRQQHHLARRDTAGPPASGRANYGDAGQPGSDLVSRRGDFEFPDGRASRMSGLWRTVYLSVSYKGAGRRDYVS